MTKEKRKGYSQQNDVRWVLATLILGALYLLIGLSIPDYPAFHHGKLIYPLLVLYKSNPAFHLFIMGFILITNILIFFRNCRNNIKVALAGLLVLLFSCGMIRHNINLPIRPGTYQHHDSLSFKDHIYYVGSSHGLPDYRSLFLNYIVYQCDRIGLICENYYIPSDKIFSPFEITHAEFIASENDGWIYLRIRDSDSYPMFCNARSEIKCGSVE